MSNTRRHSSTVARQFHWGPIPFLALCLALGFAIFFVRARSELSESEVQAQSIPPPRPSIPKRGNVVLIISDDHGRDLGVYGNPVIHTPHIDGLAADGLLFTHAFCTTASCSASRSVILTGLHNHWNGQFGHAHDVHNFHTRRSLGRQRPLLPLPVLLARAGYRTARIGKLHVQPEDLYAFESVLDGNPGGARHPVAMADRCEEFIAGGEKPFFLYFCPADPHRSGTRRNDRPGSPDRFGNPAGAEARAGIERRPIDPAAVVVPSFLPDIPECRAELAEYYESVDRVDQGVGRLIEILRRAGKYDDTLIIYASDNGVAFPGAKTNLYEPGMRLPLIVRAPGMATRGVKTSAMVSWVDLTPTVLDFADGLPLEQRFHGRSFLDVVADPERHDRDRVFASHTFHEVTMYYPMRVLRERRFKYILNLASGLEFPFASDLFESATWQGTLTAGLEAYGRRSVAAYLRRPRRELYDLVADPDEVRNLADDPGFAAVVERLDGDLREWQEASGDPWIVKRIHE
jgi:N-sulfoglucosamine sulfohydrolase